MTSHVVFAYIPMQAEECGHRFCKSCFRRSSNWVNIFLFLPSFVILIMFDITILSKSKSVYVKLSKLLSLSFSNIRCFHSKFD